MQTVGSHSLALSGFSSLLAMEEPVVWDDLMLNGKSENSSVRCAFPIPVLRENPIGRSNPFDPRTRSRGVPLVSISRRLEQTPIAPGKPLASVTGTRSTKAPVSGCGPTTTMQPAGSRDATRSTQESLQVCHPTASAHRLPDQDPVSRSALDERGLGCTSRRIL